jgi:transposase
VDKYAMTIGLDVGDQYSHFFALNEQERPRRGRVKTSREDIASWAKLLARSRIILEVGPHSRWISQFLSEAGHDVIVANPRKVGLISGNTRKGDQRDAELLARLGRVDPQLLSPIQHRSDAMQRIVVVIRARDGLVRARAQLINSVRGIAKSFGYKLARCSAETFHRLAIPVDIEPQLRTLIDAVSDLKQRIRATELELEKLATTLPATRALRDVIGVGPILSLAFVAMLEDPQRFRRNRAVGAFLGLCPRRNQSGNDDPELPISKAGNSYLRSLLVNAAHAILRTSTRDSDLKRWGTERIERGGKNAKKRVVVAVARKLAVLLLKLWKTGETYAPLKNAALAA